MSDWVEVARVEDLPAGAWKVVDAGDARIAVFNIDGCYCAIEDLCTHDGGELASGCLDGDVIVCPRHGARFCVRTGEALSAPAFEPTAVFPVRVERGIVQVRDDRWD
ncbi:MAG: non-heme iron oxygenase ferredoxin subunit [Burkholderiales bacterium]|nr:non-heme iron oxygenase ferredoxin subunit [Burkholderiales bacterium]